MRLTGFLLAILTTTVGAVEPNSGKVTAVSARDRSLVEIELKHSGAIPDTAGAWHVGKDDRRVFLGKVEVIRQKEKSVVVRGIGFEPRVGDEIVFDISDRGAERNRPANPVASTPRPPVRNESPQARPGQPAIRDSHPLVGEMRVWTDVDGLQLAAKLMHVDSKTVVLQRANGTETIVAFEMLSPEDQRDLKNGDPELAAKRQELDKQRAVEIARRREAESERVPTQPPRTASGNSSGRTAPRTNRDGPIVVENETTSDIVFIVNEYHNSHGGGVTFDDGGKPRMGIRDIAESLNSIFRNDYEPLRPLRFDVKAGERLQLSRGGRSIQANSLRYDVENAHGTVSRKANVPGGSPEFLIKVTDTDLHTPKLVRIGRWKVEQDVWYTTHRAQRPVEVVPVTGWFSSKIEYYRVYGGQEYEYEREHRGGIATASADIENPTDSELSVEIILEFRFQHVILSGDRVSARMSLPPRVKTKVYAEVNTRGFLDNRTVTGATTVDVIAKKK